jgi:hypothetical protein
MKISRIAVAIGALLSLGAAVAPASAGVLTYDWTLSLAPGVTTGGFEWTGSGTVIVNTASGQSYDSITSLTGSVTNGTTTDLLSLAPIGTLTSDNRLFANGAAGTQSLDSDGITVETGGAVLFNLFAEGTAGVSSDINVFTEGAPPAEGSIGQGTFAVSLAPVPLPSSVWMLILGLGGLVFAALRKSKQPRDESIGAFAA